MTWYHYVHLDGLRWSRHLKHVLRRQVVDVMPWYRLRSLPGSPHWITQYNRWQGALRPPLGGVSTVCITQRHCTHHWGVCQQYVSHRDTGGCVNSMYHTETLHPPLGGVSTVCITQRHCTHHWGVCQQYVSHRGTGGCVNSMYHTETLHPPQGGVSTVCITQTHCTHHWGVCQQYVSLRDTGGCVNSMYHTETLHPPQGGCVNSIYHPLVVVSIVLGRVIYLVSPSRADITLWAMEMIKSKSGTSVSIWKFTDVTFPTLSKKFLPSLEPSIWWFRIECYSSRPRRICWNLQALINLKFPTMENQTLASSDIFCLSADSKTQCTN